MQEVCHLHWQPGQNIGEFFFTLKRKAAYAKLGLKHVASIMAGQLSREIQNKIKGNITEIDDDLEHADAHKLLRTIKVELVDKGYAIDKGNRSFEAVSKVATVQSKEPEEGTEHDPTVKVAYARGKTHPVRS